MKTTLAGAIQQIDGQPIQACYVGVDAAERLAAFVSDRLGAACLVVADENTLAAGGERLLRALSAASRSTTSKPNTARASSTPPPKARVRRSLRSGASTKAMLT